MRSRLQAIALCFTLVAACGTSADVETLEVTPPTSAPVGTSTVDPGPRAASTTAPAPTSTQTTIPPPTTTSWVPVFASATSAVTADDLHASWRPGCPVTVAGGLPSTSGMGGHTQGPAAVAFLDGQLYILQDSGSAAATAFPDMPNGVYLANADGSVALLLDHMPHEQAAVLVILDQ